MQVLLTIIQDRCKMKADDDKIHFAVFGLENQTKLDKRMVLRIFGYDGASYRCQYEEKRLCPVVTLVLNFSETSWPEECKHLYGIIEVPDELKPFTPDYTINAVDICDLDEKTREMFTSDFKMVADLFYYKKHNPKEYCPSDDKVKHVNELLDFFQIFTNDKRYVEIKENVIGNQKGDVTMCTIADYLEEKGIEKGIEQGSIKTTLEFISEGFITPQQGADKLHISIEKLEELAKEYGIDF